MLYTIVPLTGSFVHNLTVLALQVSLFINVSFSVLPDRIYSVPLARHSRPLCHS